MRARLAVCLLAWALAPVVAAAGAKPRLVVLDLVPAGGLDPSVAAAMTEAITQQVAHRGLFDVISSREIGTLVQHERQKQVLGCANDGTSCLAELADAVGARFILSGTLAKLGDAYQLTLQTLDSSKATPIGRATRISPQLPQLQNLLPYIVAEATATPLPPPPSHVLSYSLLGAGGVAALAGSLTIFQSITTQTAIARELDDGLTNPSALQSLQTYRDARSSSMTQELIGIGIVAAGALLIGGGIWASPTDPQSGAHAALVPTGNGFALAGVWR